MAIVAPTLYLASTAERQPAARPAAATISALQLQLDEAAIKSLRASPETEVAGRLSTAPPRLPESHRLAENFVKPR